MDNVKKHIYIYLSVLFFIFFLLYLWFAMVNKIPDEYVINYKKNKIDHFLSKYKKIDVLIIGGSNALFGISAQMLSKKSNKIFYNLSLFREGINHKNYTNYLTLTTPDSTRKKIRLVLYSTLSIYTDLRSNDLVNEKKVSLFGQGELFQMIPEISIISWLNKKYRLKNETDSIPPFATLEYGGYRHKKHIDFIDKNSKFKRPKLKTIVEGLVYKKNEFSQIYPNAKFIVIAPPIFNENSNEQNTYILELTRELEKRDINFIAQPPHRNSHELIWHDNEHLNELGRKIYTEELYKILLIKFNLSDILK